MKQLGIFLILIVFLCGYTKKPPVCRVVTGVEVVYAAGSDTLSRSYTKDSSIRSILTYLRMLRPHGPAVPEAAEKTACRITLRYSHGKDSVYLQQGKEFLQRDGGDWQQIDSSRAALLHPLLLLLPSDG